VYEREADWVDIAEEGSGALRAGARQNQIAYRLRLTSSCNISSLVVIARELAWNARWVMIMSTNSLPRSTLDCSSVPERI
jgi:hypothetical protein